MNESTDMASNIQQVTIIMRSKVELLAPHLVFLLALALMFSFSMAAYSGYAHAANCAQKIKQCEKQISKLRDQQVKLEKKALKLVKQRSKIRHEYAPVRSALSEIKTMQGLLRDSKAELDAAAKASGNRVSYQSNGRAMGVVPGSGRSGGSANVQLDIYNTQFDKYQPTLKDEKKLNKKAKGFQKKLDKSNKAIAKTDKKSAAIKKKITAQQKKCRKLADACHGKKKHPIKANKYGGYPGSSVNGGNNDADSGYGNYGNGDNVAGNGNGYDNGDGSGNGNGYDNGDGSGNGNGYNNGDGSGNGNGYDNGDGYEHGGISTTNGYPDDNACIPGANDITNPFILTLPSSENTANKAKSALGGFAKGAIGGLLGGGGGMIGGGSPFGGSGGGDGARPVNTPKGPWYKFSSGETNVEITGWLYKPRSKKVKPEIRIAQRIMDSPDDGGPHMMILQNRDGQVLRPTGYMIFEVWKHWKLTITITRDTWVNGEHTSHTVTRESTQWRELAGRYKRIMEAPGIWEQFGVSPFGKLKGIIAQFPLPEHFNPAEWTLVKHDTAKAMVNGKEFIKTVPFVISIGQGEKKRLTFKSSPDGKTGYQRTHGCQSLDEAMHDLMTRYEPQSSGLNESGKPQKKLNRYKLNKTKMDAAHWARIFILQPAPTDKWLKDYHRLSQNMQVDGAVAMADIIFRIATGTGVDSWDPKLWQKEFSRLSHQLRNMAIMAANRWKHGMNEKQRKEVYRSYSKLPSGLQQIFQREFVYTLATNLFLDLRQPEPVVLKPMNGARGGASIH